MLLKSFGHEIESVDSTDDVGGLDKRFFFPGVVQGGGGDYEMRRDGVGKLAWNGIRCVCMY